MYEDEQFDYLNDSQRGFIVTLDGTDDYLRQAKAGTRRVSEVRVHHIPPMTSRDKRKMAKVASDNRTRLF